MVSSSTISIKISFCLFLDSSKLADIPTKSDGTADMRYTESREAVSSGLISKDEVIEGKTDSLNLKQTLIISSS
jgi:hypothetical protein